MMHSWKNRIGWTSRCLLATAAVAIGTAGATSAHAALTITPPANVIWEFGAPQQGLPTIIITADSNFIGSHAITIVGGGINDKIAEIVVNQEGQAGSELRLDITEIDTFCAITQGPDGTGRYVVDKLETIILGTQTLPLPYTIYAHNIKDVTVALNMYIMMEILDDGDVFESNSQISNVSAVGSEAHFTNEHGPIEVINVRSMTIADIHGLSLNDLTSGTFVKGAVIGDPAVPLGERIMTIEGFFDVGGDFVGTMDVKSIENVSIGGNLDADITVTMPLPADPPLGG